jgi:hypothetical protein
VWQAYGEGPVLPHEQSELGEPGRRRLGFRHLWRDDKLSKGLTGVCYWRTHFRGRGTELLEHKLTADWRIKEISEMLATADNRLLSSAMSFASLVVQDDDAGWVVMVQLGWEEGERG